MWKQAGDTGVDEHLANVMEGIFPEVDIVLFSAFLMPYSAFCIPQEPLSFNIKDALEKTPNFFMVSGSSYVSYPNEDEEMFHKRMAETNLAKSVSQEKETIQVILHFFDSSHPFKISKPSQCFWPLMLFNSDLSEEEHQNWEHSTAQERTTITTKIKNKKLEAIKATYESEEIQEICKLSEKKERYRKQFLTLIELLLSEIETHPQHNKTSWKNKSAYPKYRKRFKKK